MAKIQISNPRQTINGGAKKYYFKIKGLGGPKGDRGDKGDTGSRGPQGEPGNAATVYVGSTTTLPVGQDATVENVGTQYNAVLNFGIPQGPRGPQGIQGERGEPGQTGQTGPRGPQGEKGTNATVYVGTTTTTNPGTQARVYNSGTDSNAVLNFEIPRGDVGPQPELVQTTGTSTTKAMSQNATTEALNGKQNTLTAGSNIQISGSTISATDTTYTAGNGLNLNGTEFSADTTVLATQTDLTTALAPKLEAEVVAELPTTGTEGKLYLTPKAHTTSTATGNPITATVTDGAGQIDSFKLDGDTLQNGTPTPEEPVAIQTVTGLQTISINGTDYPLDLGTIELCKLGDYQDYIWKDGEDWKVHKAIRKTIVNGGGTWEAALSSLWGSNAYACSSIKGYKPWSPTKSDRFIDAELPQAANIQSGYMQMAGFSWVIRIDSVTSVAELKTWLSSNNVNLYYVLATATDTTITDTELISQLEAIRTASLENGSNTITNTATAPNLAGDMEVGYYGYNPTNRYDKWLWLDLNNNYEQIGS